MTFFLVRRATISLMVDRVTIRSVTVQELTYWWVVEEPIAL